MCSQTESSAIYSAAKLFTFCLDFQHSFIHKKPLLHVRVLCEMRIEWVETLSEQMHSGT